MTGLRIMKCGIVREMIPMADPQTERYVSALHRMAGAVPDIERVVLFGSRARSSHRPGSDLDFAIWAAGLSGAARAKWERDWQEGKPGLVKTDWIWVDEAPSAALLERVKSEGIVVYERAAD